MLIILALILSLACSLWVKITFKKYAKVPSSMTGAEAARYVLDKNGLTNIPVEKVSGSLTDHYDPKANVVRLSDSTYNSKSASAVGVAAHECGHAVQHAQGYLPIKIRSAIVPVVNFCSNTYFLILILGLLFEISGLIWLGIIMFGATFVFGIVTLPVEFNASNRALKTLKSDNKFSEEDYKCSKKVLTAAASTYVASVIMSLAYLLRYIGMGSSRN